MPHSYSKRSMIANIISKRLIPLFEQLFTKVLNGFDGLADLLTAGDKINSVEHKTNEKKTKVAVFFGGQSPEHDVSVVTGLQVMQAIDSTQFEVFPVYVAADGRWFTGDALFQRENYLPSPRLFSELQELLPTLEAGRGARLLPIGPKRTFQQKPIDFDVALLSFHGLNGEDGHFQGLMEAANIPYTGMRAKASTILMDKHATKLFLKALEIPVLPYALLKRPLEGYYLDIDIIRNAMNDLKFPCILKPSHLGSSIGVAKVNSLEEIQENLPAIFAYDHVAILEPFVENLVEYNAAVCRSLGNKNDHSIQVSAIEKPKTSQELLDFKEKYLAGGSGQKGGVKSGAKSAGTAISQGMLSLTRDINPELPETIQSDIHRYAKILFDQIDGAGLPRIDYISNGKTGELWMNEVNPIPGSMGYFLWEAAENSIGFTDLMTGLIEEAFDLQNQKTLPKDPVPKDARLLKR